MLIPAVGLMMILAAQPANLPDELKPIEVAGKVREVGAGVGGTARALLVLDDKTEYELHGVDEGHRSELRRLSSVRIRVFGVVNDPRIPRGRHIRVERYEILDVGGGVVPRIGQLAQLSINGKDRLLFVDGSGNADLLPLGWGRKLKRHVGAKVWMVGSGSGSTFKPKKFAILRTRRTEQKPR